MLRTIRQRHCHIVTLLRRRGQNHRGQTSCGTAIRLHDIHLLPLAIDAHLLGKLPENHARNIDPAYADRQCMKTWLRKCEREHQSCESENHAVNETGYMPRRLINVRAMCIEESPFVTLRYFALSYLWGEIDRKHLPLVTAQEASCPGFLLQENVKDQVHTLV